MTPAKNDHLAHFGPRMTHETPEESQTDSLYDDAFPLGGDDGTCAWHCMAALPPFAAQFLLNCRRSELVDDFLRSCISLSSVGGRF